MAIHRKKGTQLPAGSSQQEPYSPALLGGVQSIRAARLGQPSEPLGQQSETCGERFRLVVTQPNREWPVPHCGLLSWEHTRNT